MSDTAPGTRPAPPARDDKKNDDGAAPAAAAGAAVPVPARNDAVFDNAHAPMVAQPQQGADAPAKDLPKGFPLIANIFCFSTGMIALVILFDSLASGYIKVAPADNGTITYDTAFLTVNSVQILNDSNVIMFILTLILGMIVCPLNILELAYPRVMAKHRVKQLTFNRLASGAHMANFMQAVISIVGYVRRWQKIAAGSVDERSYRFVLAFWIFLTFTGLLQALVHRLTPNENKRRFDRDFGDESQYANSPDRQYDE